MLNYVGHDLSILRIFLFLYRFELIVGTDEKKKERKEESTDYFSCMRILHIYIYENVRVSNYIMRHNIKGEIDFFNIFIRSIYIEA